MNLKKKYIADTTDPVFGEMVEFEVNIPVQKDLTVTIMDRRKFLKAGSFLFLFTKLASLRKKKF